MLQKVALHVVALIAIISAEEALKERTRERIPWDWAETQDNLGNTFLTWGERESGTEQLTLAISAYEDALKVYESEPLGWAMTASDRDSAL
jgi:hypothetical protein